MEITKDTYHLKTKAEFEFLGYGNKAEKKFKELAEEYGIFYESDRSMSKYIIVGETVYRYSDHWGKVATCDWKLNWMHPNDGKPWFISPFYLGKCDLKDFEDMKTYDDYYVFDKFFEEKNKVCEVCVPKKIANLEDLENNPLRRSPIKIESIPDIYI